MEVNTPSNSPEQPGEGLLQWEDFDGIRCDTYEGMKDLEEKIHLLLDQRDKAVKFKSEYKGTFAIIQENERLKLALGEAEKMRDAYSRLVENFLKHRSGQTVAWSNAGGPNECKHGFAAGLVCIECTEIEARHLLSQKAKGKTE